MENAASATDNRWIWPFELEAQIGSGGMGVVYRARFVKNDRRVALKLLPEGVASNATIVARFERELEILKDLRHPHIVHCFGGTCEGSRRFYAMELVEGGTIESVLKEQGRINGSRTIEYALELCSALAYAHAQGVIHRDIKPGNLLLTKDGKIKLGDFGLALMAASNKLTAAGKTMGTLFYMAPEQIRGRPPISHKTDLYAMGCVLFEMLTGNPPFVGNSPGEILHQHIHVEAPKVRTIVKDCPEVLESVIFDLMQKDPGDRPADAWVVARRLKGIEQSVTVRAARPEQGIGNQPTRSVTINKIPDKISQTPLTQTRTLSDSTVAADVPFPWKSLVIGFMLLLVAWRLSLSWAVEPSLAVQAENRAETLWVEALKNPNVDVRQSAARALGELGPAVAVMAVPPLADRLADTDARVRKEVVIALGKMGAEAKVAHNALLKVSNTDESSDVREHAKGAYNTVQNAKPHPPVAASPRPARSVGQLLLMLVSVLFTAAALWILVERPFDRMEEFAARFRSE